MALERAELLAALEAIVFVASEPVTVKTLCDLFPDEEQSALEGALERLVEVHAEPDRGLVVSRVAGGYRITTRPEVADHVERLIKRERAERLSLRTLETLSVIAYKQPVTSAEVAEIRGVDPSGTIKTLLDKGLVKVAGRKKVVGRPFVYGTTKSFLSTFGLNDLSELPTLKEIEELDVDITTTDVSEVEDVQDDQLGMDEIVDEAPVDAPTEESS